MTRRSRDLSASLRRLGRTITPAGWLVLAVFAVAVWRLTLSILGVLA